MITNLNIRGYINYLYLQRNGSNAPQELLQKWSALPNDDIKNQLHNLYTSWHLSLQESNQYEQQYVEAINASLPKIEPISSPKINTTPHQILPHQTQEARPYIPQKKSSSILAWLFALIGVGCIIGFGIWAMQNKSKDVAANEITPSENNIPSVAPAIIEEPIINFDSAKNATQTIATDSAMDGEDEEELPSTIALSESDNQNINSIKQLITAEEDRDFDKIYSYYSPSMEKYWDINYPTRDELQTRYAKVWQRSSNPKHTNVEVQKMAENKYVASGLYEFFQVKTNSTKIISFKNVFSFDENGKILITDELK
jgi:hypothetical protein